MFPLLEISFHGSKFHNNKFKCISVMCSYLQALFLIIKILLKLQKVTFLDFLFIGLQLILKQM